MPLSKNTTTYTLNSGHKIPAVGLGTWQSEEGDARNAVKVALKNGYRHIDTAAVYGNEEEVGQGIKDSGVPRSDIFITTKLWNTDHDNVQGAIEASLKRLEVDYVDLFLIHWPIKFNKDNKPVDSNVNDTYKQLQKLVKLGQAKSIGVSNFTKEQLENLLADPEVTVTPAVVQIEGHPLLPQDELLSFLKSRGIYGEYYSPLGSSGTPLFEVDAIKKISEKNKATPAQTIVSWAVQRGVIVLPKSVTDERIISNLDTYTLSDDDFAELNNLAKKEGVKRTNNPEWDGKKVFEE
jgi:glycerol 2-dehydrogenase (NADP+)